MNAKKRTLLALLIASCCIIKANEQHSMIRLGTDYGGWTIPADLLDKDSICYFAGAGLDISFDLAVIQHFGCHVYTIDPTPKSIKHIDYIKQEIANGKVPFTNNGKKRYTCKMDDFEYLHFLPYGLWKDNTTMKFYSPKRSQHVSHSILNLQKTKTFFEAECKRLSTLMKELGHDHIDLLKLDIEGAEYAVVESILEDNLDIRCICLEFDEFAGINRACNNDMKGSLERAHACIRSLEEHGYKAIYQDTLTDMTFIKIEE